MYAYSSRGIMNDVRVVMKYIYRRNTPLFWSIETDIIVTALVNEYCTCRTNFMPTYSSISWSVRDLNTGAFDEVEWLMSVFAKHDNDRKEIGIIDFEDGNFILINKDETNEQLEEVLVKVCTHRYEVNRIVVKPGDKIATGVQVSCREGGQFSLYFMPDDEKNVQERSRSNKDKKSHHHKRTERNETKINK
jgi:hypothetical protein